MRILTSREAAHLASKASEEALLEEMYPEYNSCYLPCNDRDQNLNYKEK